MTVKLHVECTEFIGTFYCVPFFSVVGLVATAYITTHQSHAMPCFFVLLQVKLFSTFFLYSAFPYLMFQLFLHMFPFFQIMFSQILFSD